VIFRRAISSVSSERLQIASNFESENKDTSKQKGKVKLDLEKNFKIKSTSNLDDDDSQIISIFKKELNSSNSASRKQSSKVKQRCPNERNIPFSP